MRGRLGSGSKLPSDRHLVYSKIPRNSPWLNVFCCFEDAEDGQIILSEAVGRKPGNVGLASSPPLILAQRMEGQALGQQPVTQTPAPWHSHPWGCTALCLVLGCFQQSNKQGSTTRSSRSVHKQQESYPNSKTHNLRLGGKLKSSNTHVMLDSQWRAQMRGQKMCVS